MPVEKPWFNVRREEILTRRRRILEDIARLGSVLRERQSELGVLAAQYQDLYHMHGVEPDKELEVKDGKAT